MDCTDLHFCSSANPKKLKELHAMKRPLESATSESPFPLSQRLRGRFLLYGNVCVDCAFQVASFPIFGLVCPTPCGGKGTNIVVVGKNHWLLECLDKPHPVEGCQASFFQWSGLFEEFKLMPRSRTIILGYMKYARILLFYSYSHVLHLDWCILGQWV